MYREVNVVCDGLLNDHLNNGILDLSVCLRNATSIICNDTRRLPQTVTEIVLPKYGLTSLTCKSNGISSLKIPEKSPLRSIDCSDNRFTSLDLRHCGVLEHLDCCDNYIENLIVPSNTEFIYCSFNCLKVLDLSNVYLISLRCDHNQITHLRLPDTLKSIECQYNCIQQLILPPNLVSLECVGNPIRELNLPPGLETLRASNLDTLTINTTVLEVLQLDGCQLTELWVPSSVRQLACINCPSLTHIHITHNLIDLTLENCPVVFTSHHSRISMYRAFMMGVDKIKDMVERHYMDHSLDRIIDLLIIKGHYWKIMRLQQWLHRMYWSPDTVFGRRKVVRIANQYVCRRV